MFAFIIITLLFQSQGNDLGYQPYIIAEICSALYVVDTEKVNENVSYISQYIRKELNWVCPKMPDYKSENYEKNIPLGVLTHYENFLSSLNCLIMVKEGDNKILKKGIEKLLSEQNEDGSWVRMFYFTSRTIGVLSKYYKLTHEDKILKAITKANIWLLNKSSSLQYDPYIIDLYSFALTNLPEEEEKKAALIKQRLKQEWLNNEIPLFYPSHFETCLYLLKNKSITDIEKKGLSTKIVNITLEDNFWKERKNNMVDIALTLRLISACKKHLSSTRQSDIESFLSKGIRWIKNHQSISKLEVDGK